MRHFPIAKYIAAFSLLFPSVALAQTSQTFDEQVRQTLLRNPDIILEVFSILESRQKEESLANDQQLIKQNSDELFGVSDFTSGNVLVEFADYQCGYCRQSGPIIESILSDNPNIRLRLIELPILGDQSREYAAKMLAIKSLYGEDTYIELHNIFILNREGELQNFDTVVAQHGLSPQRIYDASLSDEISAKIAANLDLANILGINGTPGFVTRSKIIRGFVQKPVLLQALSGS